jgi:hypothetical protein
MEKQPESRSDLTRSIIRAAERLPNPRSFPGEFYMVPLFDSPLTTAERQARIPFKKVVVNGQWGWVVDGLDRVFRGALR